MGSSCLMAAFDDCDDDIPPSETVKRNFKIVEWISMLCDRIAQELV
jgi:hypothetical protein